MGVDLRASFADTGGACVFCLSPSLFFSVLEVVTLSYGVNYARYDFLSCWCVRYTGYRSEILKSVMLVLQATPVV